MIKYNLSKKQKLDYIDSSIVDLKTNPEAEYFLCLRLGFWFDKHGLRLIKEHDSVYDDDVIDAFPELQKEIQKALKRTDSFGGAITYEQEVTSRIKLLKRVRKIIA